MARFGVLVTLQLATTVFGQSNTDSPVIYWVEWWGGDSKIRSNAQLSDDPLVTTRCSIGGLAVDNVLNRIIWSEEDCGRICSTDLNGNDRRIHASNLRFPGAIAVDSLYKRVYFTTGSSTVRTVAIQYVDLDSSQVVSLSFIPLTNVNHLEIDSHGRRLYYNDADFALIRSTDIKGGNRGPPLCIGNQGSHIAFDRNNGKIYFSNERGIDTIPIGTQFWSPVINGPDIDSSSQLVLSPGSVPRLTWTELNRVITMPLNGRNETELLFETEFIVHHLTAPSSSTTPLKTHERHYSLRLLGAACAQFAALYWGLRLFRRRYGLHRLLSIPAGICLLLGTLCLMLWIVTETPLLGEKVGLYAGSDRCLVEAQRGGIWIRLSTQPNPWDPTGLGIIEWFRLGKYDRTWYPHVSKTNTPLIASNWLVDVPLWIVVVAFFVPPLRRMVIIHRRSRRNACLQCGYSLNALESDACPECGRAVNPSATSS